MQLVVINTYHFLYFVDLGMIQAREHFSSSNLLNARVIVLAYKVTPWHSANESLISNLTSPKTL